MNNSDKPAMPLDDLTNKADYMDFSGLTKREYFAGLAMMGMQSNQGLARGTKTSIAEWSVQQADALLAELDK